MSGGRGIPPAAALQSQGVPPMQVSSQAMMAPPVLPAHLAGQDTSAMTTPGQQAQPMPVKFDISQILSVIRNNMSAATPQNVEYVNCL